ncbi:hypothetical protein Scep_002442 [Stephania cephalantha]|uniref:Uncharacterized protein n=1 Tax=Stephania cephalantha TaxID=152367 RepID=A0AAP0LA85_9MAGN
MNCKCCNDNLTIAETRGRVVSSDFSKYHLDDSGIYCHSSSTTHAYHLHPRRRRSAVERSGNVVELQLSGAGSSSVAKAGSEHFGVVLSLIIRQVQHVGVAPGDGFFGGGA